MTHDRRIHLKTRHIEEHTHIPHLKLQLFVTQSLTLHNCKVTKLRIPEAILKSNGDTDFVICCKFLIRALPVCIKYITLICSANTF